MSPALPCTRRTIGGIHREDKSLHGGGERNARRRFGVGSLAGKTWGYPP